MQTREKRMEADSPAEPVSSSPGQTELIWPPPESEIEAFEIVDVTPMDAVPLETLFATEESVLPVLAPRLPAAASVPALAGDAAHTVAPRRRGRMHIWMLCIGLTLVEFAEFRASRLSSSAAPRDPRVVSVAHAPAAAVQPPAAAPRPAAQSAAPRPVVTDPAVRMSRRTTARHTPSRQAPHKLPVEPEARTDTPVPQELPAMEQAPVVAVAAVAGFVPPRAIGDLRPRLVPSPFPIPRGARTSLELVIDESGRVSSARVAESGAGFYDQPLLTAARGWRFEPATVGGQPTRATHRVNVPIK